LAGDAEGVADLLPGRAGRSGGNNLFAAGLPNVDTLGVRGGDIHSENEFAWPDSFAERAQLSALILMKLASGEIDARGIRALMEAR
jgi:glutamate carboxypeptidase